MLGEGSETRQSRCFEIESGRDSPELMESIGGLVGFAALPEQVRRQGESRRLVGALLHQFPRHSDGIGAITQAVP